MKCPLRFTGCEIDALKPPETRFLCLKEECAWWVETQDRCAIKDVALSLGYISMDVTQIYNKMPHEGQFRK